jgi:hypothetical protein
MTDGAETQDVDSAHAKAVKRVEDSFREVYLTLISIIQGVALGFLVQTIGTDYHNISIDKFGRTATIFVAIVLIWQEYSIGSTMYAWIPSSIDALVPFLLGAGEGMMIAALNGSIEEFLFFTTCTWAVGVIAGVNYAVHATRARLRTSRESQKILAIHPRTLPALDSAGLILTAAMFGYSVSQLPQPHPAVLSWLTATLPMVALASLYWRWTRPIGRADA